MARLALVLSALAVALAAVALAVSLARGLAPGGSACQTAAWNSVPGPAALPGGWSVVSSGFFLDSVSATLVGPAASDASSGQPTIYVTVGCYGGAGHDALARSHAAARSAGEVDVAVAALGDESFGTKNDAAGSLSVYVRRGDLLASLAASETIDLGTVEDVAAVVDGAMATALGQPAPSGTRPAGPSQSASPAGSPGASPAGSPGASPAGSASPSPSGHGAPALEQLIPAAVSGTTLEKDSTNGQELAANDANSDLVSAIQGLGKQPADLGIAEGHDPAGALDLSLVAFELDGIAAGRLQASLVDSGWLTGGGQVTSSTVTIAGKSVTRLVYADGSPDDYLYAHGTVLYDVVTGDAGVASTVLGLLP